MSRVGFGSSSSRVERLCADLQKHLVVNGGFVGLKVYNSARYTVEVDALVVKADVESILEHVKQSSEMDLDDGVWFRFEDQIDLATQGEDGSIRRTFRAGIGETLLNVQMAQVVHFDVAIGHPVTPGPVSTITNSLIILDSNQSHCLAEIMLSGFQQDPFHVPHSMSRQSRTGLHLFLSNVCRF